MFRLSKSLLLAVTTMGFALASTVIPATAFAAANLNTNGKNVNGVEHSTKDDESDSSVVLPEQANEHAGSAPNKQEEAVAPAADNGQEKVRICHRTASYGNPYVSITVARSAVDGIAGNSGNQADHYGEHKGPIFNSNLPKHTEWGDIIPALNGGHNGQNWTIAGRAIYNNDCKITTTDTTPQNNDKVTLCHATGSSTNPYVRISISTAGVYNGHMDHQDKWDIIPPFTFQGKQYSLNWDAAGQATWNNDCKPAQGQGSGPTTPNVNDPSTPAATKLANTGIGIWVTSLVSIMIIAMSTLLGLLTRRKMITA